MLSVDVEDVPFVDEQTGLAVVATTRADQTVHTTVVNAGILAEHRRLGVLVAARRDYAA